MLPAAPPFVPAPALPPLPHSSFGVNPALAQSMPSCSDWAGQLASQARATELSLSQLTGPRTQDMCNRGSNERPASLDSPTKKPAWNSSAQPNNPALVQLKQRSFWQDSRSNARSSVRARQTPSTRLLAMA